MHFFAQIDAWIKLQMFRSIKRFRVTKIDAAPVSGSVYVRCYVELVDLHSDSTFDGMAEGRTENQARVRAIAEAYERLCLKDYCSRTGFRLDADFVFGLGVALQKRNAILGAYGEYWERHMLAGGTFEKILAGESASTSIRCPSGMIYVHALKRPDGTLGSGYGSSMKAARDSAERSAIRKRDFMQTPRTFRAPEKVPIQLRLTPPTEGWLECYLVGFTASS